MKRGHEPDAVPVLPLASHAADGDLLLKHVLKCGPAKGDDHARANNLDLLFQKRRTGGDFIRRRLAISRRTTLDDVDNKHLLAHQPHPGDHFVKKISGAAHEWTPLQVFVLAWAFTDKHYF